MHQLLFNIKNKTHKTLLSDQDKQLLFSQYKSYIKENDLMEVCLYSHIEAMKDPKKHLDKNKELDWLAEISYMILEPLIINELIDKNIHSFLKNKVSEALVKKANRSLSFENDPMTGILELLDKKTNELYRIPNKSVLQIFQEWLPQEKQESLFYVYLYYRFDKNAIKSIKTAYTILKCL